jgi:hypothetical protein
MLMGELTRAADELRVVGAYFLSVDVREGVVAERFGHAPLDEIGRRVHPDGTEVVDYRGS